MAMALIRDGQILDIVQDGMDFPVHPEMSWEYAADGINSDDWFWNGNGFQLKPTVVPNPLSAIDSVKAIKAEAQRRIYAICPAWKQINLTARSAELLRIKIDAGRWSDSEIAEAAQIDSVWEKAKAIRAYSNTLEAAILSGQVRDIAMGWPEF